MASNTPPPDTDPVDVLDGKSKQSIRCFGGSVIVQATTNDEKYQNQRPKHMTSQNFLCSLEFGNLENPVQLTE
jgi:hypothetical protein